MRATKLPAIAMLVVLAACPLSPKDERRTDDGADEGAQDEGAQDETVGATPATPETTGTTGTTTGTAELSCEEELEQVKAELAACQGSK